MRSAPRLASVLLLGALALVGGPATAQESRQRDHLRLAFAHQESEDIELVREQSKRFEASHPGVDVEVVGERERETPTHHLWARYLALGDPSIDVYVIDEPWIAEFAFAGWIRPLDELADWARKDLYPAGLRSGTWRDHLYAVPLELSANALFYRPDWLSSAGLSPPRTLEELFAEARQLAHDRSLSYGLVMHLQPLFNDVNPMLWASGGGPLLDGHVRLDDPANVAVLSALRGEVGGALADASRLEAWRTAPGGSAEAMAAFGAGDAAFMINWLRAQPEGLAPDAYRVQAIPGLAGHAPGTGATVGSWFLAVNASSRNPALAGEIVRFLSTEDAGLERFQKLGTYPPLARFYSEEWEARYPKLRTASDVFANAQPRMPVPNEPEIDAIVEDAYERVLIGGAPAAATLAEASARAQAALAAFPREVPHFPDDLAEPDVAGAPRGRWILPVAAAIWVVALAALGAGISLGRRVGGLFRRLATKISVLGLGAVILSLTTGTAVALHMLVKNQEEGIAEAQAIFRAAIRDHAAALGRQIAMDAAVFREVTSVGMVAIGDAGLRAAGEPPPRAGDALRSRDMAALFRRAVEQAVEVFAAEGRYSRDIVFLQLLDTKGTIVIDDKTSLTPDADPARSAQRVVDDPFVIDFARHGRRMSMRDVPASKTHPSYVEALVPLVQEGRLAGAVHVGYSKLALEERITALRARQERLLTDAMWLVSFAAFGLIVLATVLLRSLARSVASPLVRLTELADKVGGGDLTVHADVRGRDEVSALARRLNAMVHGLRERQVIRETLGRYVGPSVSDEILSGRIELGGEQRQVTLLFSDVRGFTTMAEAMSPHEVVRVLNAYFEQMVDAVFRHEGILDKFIGDGLMAVFGAPRDNVDHAMCAVSCALEMRSRLLDVNAGLRAAGLTELAIGIGIHTGSVVVGNIGSSKRAEYTAIGDAVNLAARLESQTKEHHVDILISEATYREVADRVVADRLGEVTVKGKHNAVVVYALRGERAPSASSEAAADGGAAPGTVTSPATR